VSELSEKWASLTHRQRDALVAEATGIAVEWYPHPVTGGEDEPWIAGSGSQVDEENIGFRIDHYTTSWGYAGPLLEEMLAADCGVRFRDGHGGPTVVVCPCDASPIIAASEGEWPERIALAYLLWKGRRK